MKERFGDVATPAAPMDAFVTRPEEGRPFRCVVVFMYIWGLREELFDIARRIATVGHYCLVPNFHHRAGKGFRRNIRQSIDQQEKPCPS